jgi:small subunit ribosomal protein S5
MAKFEQRQPKEFDEKVVEIKRVSQKTKGGNKISFSALVVIGNRKGKAGIGFSKAPDVLSAIQKSVRLAKKNLVTIEMVGDGTITHEILFKYKAAKILLKPAPEGTGIIAGGPVRAVVDAFGIRNIVSKRMGTNNKNLNVHATMMAISQLLPVSESKKPKAQDIEKPIQKVEKTQ